MGESTVREPIRSLADKLDLPISSASTEAWALPRNSKPPIVPVARTLEEELQMRTDANKRDAIDVGTTRKASNLTIFHKGSQPSDGTPDPFEGFSSSRFW